MKKVVIFLSIVIILFGAILFLTKMQEKEKVNNSSNPYGKTELKPETIDQLNDPNYQNIITPDQLEKKLSEKSDVIVYFYSPRCSHCQKTTPILMPLAKKLGVTIDQFNLDEFESGWDQYKIESTPTLIHYKDGKETDRIVGEAEKAALEQWLKTNTKK